MRAAEPHPVFLIDSFMPALLFADPVTGIPIPGPQLYFFLFFLPSSIVHEDPQSDKPTADPHFIVPACTDSLSDPVLNSVVADPQTVFFTNKLIPVFFCADPDSVVPAPDPHFFFLHGLFPLLLI